MSFSPATHLLIPHIYVVYSVYPNILVAVYVLLRVLCVCACSTRLWLYFLHAGCIKLYLFLLIVRQSFFLAQPCTFKSTRPA